MSNATYKVCAHCGQPAVNQMPQCRRCGMPFPNVSETIERRQRIAPSRKSSGKSLAVVIALMIAALIFGGAFVRKMLRKMPNDFANVTSGQGVPPSRPPISDGNSQPDLTGGLFKERPGSAENPTVFVQNMETGTLVLELRDQSGRVYKTQCIAGQRVPLQVPAGNYGVHVSSDVPGVSATDGDATFRKFKEYDAAFSYGMPGEPLHLGD